MDQPELNATDYRPVAPRRDLRLIIFALIALCVVFVVGYVQRMDQKQKILQQIAAAQAHIGDQQQKTDELKDMLAKVSSPAYVGELARDGLGLVQPGDQLVVVMTPPATPKPLVELEQIVPFQPATPRPNWRLWLDLLFHQSP